MTNYWDDRWDIVIANPLFLYEMDHGRHWPGGQGLAHRVYHHRIEPKGQWHRSTFSIEEMEWCHANCRGPFYRMRDPERAAEAIDDPYFEPETWQNHLYSVPLNILTFELLEDAMRFKLAFRYEN